MRPFNNQEADALNIHLVFWPEGGCSTRVPLPIQAHGRNIFPIFHPAFVSDSRSWHQQSSPPSTFRTFSIPMRLSLRQAL